MFQKAFDQRKVEKREKELKKEQALLERLMFDEIEVRKYLKSVTRRVSAIVNEEQEETKSDEELSDSAFNVHLEVNSPSPIKKRSKLGLGSSFRYLTKEETEDLKRKKIY
jgi:hypothetical protein